LRGEKDQEDNFWKGGLAEHEFLEKGGDLCKEEKGVAVAWLNFEFSAAPSSQSSHCRRMRE
jgi:hypothetical protein